MVKLNPIYALSFAKMVAQSSNCLRRQYGAVITKNGELISYGCNSTPEGELGCKEKGGCYREIHNIPHGERYELCKSVHAEQNALIRANGEDLQGAILYLAGFENGSELEKPEPCLICERMIRSAGIKAVITKAGITTYD